MFIYAYIKWTNGENGPGSETNGQVTLKGSTYEVCLKPSAVPVMYPRVDRVTHWCTAQIADRSSWVWTDDLGALLTTQRVFHQVLVSTKMGNFESRLFVIQQVVQSKKTRDLTNNNLFKCFCFAKNRRSWSVIFH